MANILVVVGGGPVLKLRTLYMSPLSLHAFQWLCYSNEDVVLSQLFGKVYYLPNLF